MSIDTKKLREALQRVPRQPWSKYRATVSIPETEEFAGLALSISGLQKSYARALAGYIAAANPATTAAMLDHIDALTAEVEALRIQNEGYDGSIAKRDLEIERLRQAWQPIETAPKDGTLILLGREEQEECPAISVPGYWQEGFPDGVDYMGIGDGFVDVRHQEFSGGRDFGAARCRHAPNQPTRWMPLPAPPAALSGESNGSD